MAKTLILFLFLLIPFQGWSYLFLKERIAEAKPGDYVVTAQKKNFTLWLIRDRDDKQVLIEEISVPSDYLELDEGGWKKWVQDKAPGQTIWLVYAIELRTGRLLGLYSFNNNRWCDVDHSNNFLSTLMNLGFTEMPVNQRRRVGSALGYWNPPVIFEGKEVPNVHLDNFQARWPRDGSELADKWIDIYLPPKNSPYASYFPYWLQVIGVMAQAKIRIVDSGAHLQSPLKMQWPKGSYQQSPNLPTPPQPTVENGGNLSTEIDTASTNFPQ